MKRLSIAMVLSLAAVIIGGLAIVSPSRPVAADGSATATPTTNHGPGFTGLQPRHKCAAKLSTLAVGASTTCQVRIQNYAQGVTAENVTWAFSNVTYSVSGVTSRIGVSGPFDDGVGPWGIPSYGSLYVNFTLTREADDEAAPRYPIVCASGTNMAEVCSQSGIS